MEQMIRILLISLMTTFDGCGHECRAALMPLSTRGGWTNTCRKRLPKAALKKNSTEEKRERSLAAGKGSSYLFRSLKIWEEATQNLEVWDADKKSTSKCGINMVCRCLAGELKLISGNLSSFKTAGMQETPSPKGIHKNMYLWAKGQKWGEKLLS